MHNSGVYIRCKAKHFNFDDSSSRLFFNLEKKANNSLSLNGEIIKDIDDILPACADFYSNLFSSEPCNDSVMNNFFSDLPCLSDSEREALEGPFTGNEILSALKGMKDTSSPGPDGLPKEFYVF